MRLIMLHRKGIETSRLHVYTINEQMLRGCSRMLVSRDKLGTLSSYLKFHIDQLY